MKTILLKSAFWVCSVAIKSKQLDLQNRAFLLLPILLPNDIDTHLGHGRFMLEQDQRLGFGYPSEHQLAPKSSYTAAVLQPVKYVRWPHHKNQWHSIARYAVCLEKVPLSCSDLQIVLEPGFPICLLPPTVHYRTPEHLL